jgi:ubiquinone/menaquinone biosynthesis C-methylase UbiE
MTADSYYGTTASQYDDKREGTPGRQKEREAIARLLGEGPVLDAPVGTGAFADLYRTHGGIGIDSSNEMLAICRRKHNWLRTKRVDMLQPLPFEDDEFATALCVRFFWWMPDGDMQRVMAELRRVSRSVVFSIRISHVYGRPEPVPGKRQRQTLGHTKEQLAQALDGWRVTDDITVGGAYRVMKAVP